MYATRKTRYRTSEICNASGHYEFDGYLDGCSDSLPALEEMDIRLRKGEVFPMISSQWRPCFWRLAGPLAFIDVPAAGSASSLVPV